MNEEIFKLFSDYNPKGDQPMAINQLSEGLRSGLFKQTLLGVTGSGKTFTIANIIEKEQLKEMVVEDKAALCSTWNSDRTTKNIWRNCFKDQERSFGI